MNEKYERFKQIWLDIDLGSMKLGFCLAIYLLFFHQTVYFGRSQHYQEVGGLVGLSLSTMTWIGSMMGLYSLWIPAIVVFLISLG